jgi:hypothetical protein
MKMKKLLMLAVIAIIGFGTALANPVDVNTAKSLGQMFVQANFEQTRNAELQLYYTVSSDNGVPCAYVFNLGNEGFVIVAASDNVRPILGYSKNGAFDATNPYNGAMYMLETYKNSISYAMENNVTATPDIVGEWTSLRNCGKLNNKRAGSVGPLVETRWNQNSPYNLYAPPVQGGQSGPGGRCYAGCVATAMGQLMKHWDHPITGTGEHGYNCVGYGPTYYQYGYQYANFGATTYQWDLMPRTLTGASQEQIEAVATLLYHCGVAVDMTFDWDGSGSYSDLVPGAMASYFDYNNCVKRQRNSYSLANWIDMLKTEFDLGRPVYYSGQSSSGGHAFVCDGYDENDLMHFNFGWSGSDDDYYAVDAIDYASQAAAIFNFVPTYVYNYTVQAPSNVTATKTSDLAQEATISWTNPTQTMNNYAINSLDRVVVTRDGAVIYTEDNPAPGATMSFVDSNVPCYSTFEYRVYAVYNEVKGACGVASESFGPTCEWKIIGTTTNMTGWKSGYLVAYDAAGREIDKFTMTSNNPTTFDMNVTLGRVSFAWKAGSDNVALTFKIKDNSGAIVYQYEGNSNDIPEGVLYEGNNGCGNPAPVMTFPEVFATSDGENIILTWDETSKDLYGYNVYRDGLLCALVHGNEYVDEAPSIGGHCYEVCCLTEGGESEHSNEVCGTAGENCDPATNEWYYLQANGKPVITWEIPENDEGLSAFFIFRKENEDGEYTRVKIVAANKTEYKETKTLEEGVWYYYRVMSFYQDTDCYSAPAKSRYNNEYFVKVLGGAAADVEETAVGNVHVYPNPTSDSFTVEAENIQNVMVYNTIGQLVHSQVCEGNNAVINLSGVDAGIYMVKVVTANGETVQKVSVIR